MDTAKPTKINKRRQGNFIKTALRNPSFMSGCVIIAILILIACIPKVLAPGNPGTINARAMLKPPSAENKFGTDNFGRDIYTRVIHATPLDLQLGIVGALGPFLIGTFLGLLAGYYGGRLDSLIMRIVDVLMAFPFTVLVIGIMAILGPGAHNIYIALWSTGWLTFCRLVRGETMLAKNAEYIQSAIVAGYSDLRIMLRHLLPNVISSAIVLLPQEIIICLLTAAGMNFIGLGLPPDIPEWGNILSVGRNFISSAWWMTVIPGMFLAITGIGFSLIGDGLNDFIRTKGR